MLTPAAYHEGLARDAAAFIEVVRTADPAGTVPACPDWRLADLGRHLGSVHRWALDAIRTGRAGAEPVGPEDREALVTWLAEGATPWWRRCAAPTRTLRRGPSAPRPIGSPSGDAARRTRPRSTWSMRVRRPGSPRRWIRTSRRTGCSRSRSCSSRRQVRLGRIAPLNEGVRLNLTDASVTVVIAGDGTDPRARTAATVDRTGCRRPPRAVGAGGPGHPRCRRGRRRREVRDLRRNHAVTPRSRGSGTMTP